MPPSSSLTGLKRAALTPYDLGSNAMTPLSLLGGLSSFNSQNVGTDDPQFDPTASANTSKRYTFDFNDPDQPGFDPRKPIRKNGIGDPLPGMGGTGIQ